MIKRCNKLGMYGKIYSKHDLNISPNSKILIVFFPTMGAKQLSPVFPLLFYIEMDILIRKFK
jgi:hypothetical protein